MAGQAKPEPQVYLHGLSLLRFVAAMLVVLFHFGTFGLYSPQQWAPLEARAFPVLDGWTAYGQLGVQFFFILSGFVITMSAQDTTARAFFRKRFLRLAPVLWVCATLALIVTVSVSGQIVARLEDWARTMILMPKGPYIDGVVWTLVVEVIFYALVAIVIWKTPGRDQISRNLDRFALALGAASAAYLSVDLAVNLAGHAAAGFLDNHAFKLLLLTHGVFFAAGMLIYSHCYGAARPGKALAITAFLILGALQVVLEFGVDGWSMTPILVYVALIAATFASIRYADQISRYGPTGLFKVLGQMSYPLYLAHFAVGMHLVPVLGRYIQSELALLYVCLGLVLANAYVIATIVEPRLLRLLSKATGPARAGHVSGKTQQSLS